MANFVASSRFSIRLAVIASLALLSLLGTSTLVSVAMGNFPGLDIGSDTNMRLAQVRDLLAGQDWFDSRLMRFGYDAPIVMHWTRLADLGPAALLWLFSLFLNQEKAEIALTIVYPLLLSIPLGVATIWATHRIVPHQLNLQIAFASILTVAQIEGLGSSFMPGDIDHHNLQIIAFIVFLGASAGLRTLKSGIVAGLAIIFGLVIGPDAAPGLIASLAVIGVLWLINADHEQHFLVGLGSALIGGALVAGIAFIPRPLSNAWCDSWTVPVAAIFAGLGFFLLVAAGLGTRLKNKFVLAIVTGGFGLGLLSLMLWQFPSCLDPLPLHDPMLQRYWMERGWENLPLWEVYKRAPFLLAKYAPVVLAVIAYGIAIGRNWLGLKETLPVFAALLAGLILGILYLRGIPMASAAAAPLLAAILCQALSNAKNMSQRLLTWLLLAPAFGILLVNYSVQYAISKALVETEQVATVTTRANSTYCVGPEEIIKANQLPMGKVIAPFGLTEYLLRYTKLQIGFAGYHRAYKENLQTMNWLISSPDEARAAFKKHGITYFAVCDYTDQLVLMAEDHPDSFVAAGISKAPPSWLTPALPLRSGGMIYKIN